MPTPKPRDLPLGAMALAQSAWLVRRSPPGRICAQIVVQQNTGGVLFQPDLGGSDDVPRDGPPHAVPSAIHVDLEGQARPPRRPTLANGRRYVVPAGTDERLIDDIQNGGTSDYLALILRRMGGRHIGSVPWDEDGSIAADGAAWIPGRPTTSSGILVARAAVIA